MLKPATLAMQEKLSQMMKLAANELSLGGCQECGQGQAAAFLLLLLRTHLHRAVHVLKCVLSSILLQNVFIHCHIRVNSTLAFGLGSIRGAKNLNVEPTDGRESEGCCSNILSVAACGLLPVSLFIYMQTLPRLLPRFKFLEQWLFRRAVFLNVWRLPIL